MDMSYAQGWRPEEGDTIIGRVTDIALGRSNFGGRYPIVTILPDGEGEPVAVHAFHAALRYRLTELRPEVGERIGIKYLGKRTHKSDATLTVADYVVKVEGRGSSNVWGNVDETPAKQQSDVPVDEADFRPATTTPPPEDDLPF